ncbi:MULTISPECIES: SCP2 sterol-binding domain-containing protein [Limibacillus]|uniref:Putative sterol carrier protein n=1 Tax=Limibacillus halophilus TaxID=1579333 RepID=A0A839STC8_9PROT|nr:SCP2 sterol-binding domain-containing protein [Limibacillus halophilus]MBB3065014.1 putative sterol carrier protein [Limibacillus halophilus]
MGLEPIIDKLRAVANQNPPLGYKVNFDLGDDGAVSWDGTGTTAIIENGLSGDADTTLRLSLENARKLIGGDLDPNVAFMMGKLKVEGSMGVALKVAALLED